MELRYKDGTPMRKYNSPKLQAIEMENKNLTAVEWLREKLFKDFGLAFSDNIFEEAKKMEKKQMHKVAEYWHFNGIADEYFDDYYDRIFGK